jgi:trimethylamine--corrinoid protein Co-methyltransferase
MFLHEYDALIRNTTKPIVYSAPGRVLAESLIRMACAASGSETEFRRRPWVAGFVTPVAPLHTTPLDECLYVFAEYGVPALVRPGPMMGATSPATLAGSLSLTNAEALFTIVLYGLPAWNTAASEAKLPDAQAAAEAMYGMLLNALAGNTFTQTMGTLASGYYGAMEMLAICNEMARMIKYALRGIRVDAETMALEVFREVGHHGNFLAHDHTARNFRRELYFPKLFRRQTIDGWKAAGSKSMLEAALDQVLSLLAEAGPAPLPAGADLELEKALRQAIALK